MTLLGDVETVAQRLLLRRRLLGPLVLLLAAPSPLEGGHYIRIVSDVLGGYCHAGVVGLWHVHGDEPVCFSAMARMSAGSSSDNSTLISRGSRCRKRKANTAVADSPARQNSSISANITDGLLSPRGGSRIILSIFW